MPPSMRTSVLKRWKRLQIAQVAFLTLSVIWESRARRDELDGPAPQAEYDASMARLHAADAGIARASQNNT